MGEQESIMTTGMQPAARSAEDKADDMFGSPEILTRDYGAVIGDSVDRLTDAKGWSQEERDAHVKEVAVAFHDARINTTHASSLHSLIAHHTLNPPDDATMQQWERDSRRELRERYGLEEAERRLQVARDFVKARPALLKLVNESGVGSHPRFIEALVERTREMRVTPRAHNTPKR